MYYYKSALNLLELFQLKKELSYLKKLIKYISLTKYKNK